MNLLLLILILTVILVRHSKRQSTAALQDLSEFAAASDRAKRLGVRLCSAALAWTLLLLTAACNSEKPAATPAERPPVATLHRTPQQDDAGARAAFLVAYPVFMHPRCMNCHPVGDVPLQGDDSHPHAQNVKRGPDGRGFYALKCAACHQDTNLPGANMPPGNPNWHLPPLQTPMVFQGKTAAELARQLKDPSQTGGRTVDQIVIHVSEDNWS